MNHQGSVIMENELVLDLKEFFWRLLEQWKAIIVFVLIIILLLSGLMYVISSVSSGDTTAEESTMTKEDIIASMSAEDQEVVIGALREQENLNNLREYIYSSPFMSLDPYRINTLKIYILVNSDEDINKQLIAAYSNELLSSSIADAISNAWNNAYSTDQVSELLTTTKEISIDSEAKLSGNIVTLSVFLPDEMDPEQTLDAVKVCLPDIEEDLTNSIGEHTAKVTGSDVKVISDNDASIKQYDIFTRLYNMIFHINYINGLMTEEQKGAFESLVKNEDINSTSDTDGDIHEMGAIKPAFFTPKSVLVGFILGVFLYICIYLLFFVFSNKILSASYLESFYGMRIIGEWYSAESKGLFWLFKSPVVFKLHHKGHLDANSESKRACETICSFLENEKGNNVLLISNEDNTFIKLLTEKLNIKANVTVLTVNASDGVYLNESDVRANDICALVTDEKKTTRSDIKDICNKIATLNSKFAGTIYIG